MEALPPASRHGGALRLGILGGGQLGRMLALAAAPLGVRVIALDPQGAASPAGQVCPGSLAGSFTDASAIRELAACVDVLTVEIEHVDASALEAAARDAGVPVHPAPAAIRLIQDKLLQKEAMKAQGVPVGEFRGVASLEALEAAVKDLGAPLMVKSRLGAYDGRGNFALRAAGDAAGAWEALGGARGAGLFVEAWVPFVRELAVIVVRGRDGACATYPAVQTIQRDSICHVVLAPAPGLPGGVAAEAGRVAAAAVAAVGGAGVFGVELFELPDGRVLLNEMAPRVHNSGHFSIEAAHCSQFENHVRAVLGLPLGSVALRVPAAAMVNVLGTGDGEAHTARTWALCAAALAQPSASVHWYAKAGAVKRGRKVGHVTVTGGGVGEVVAAVRALLRAAAGEGGGGGGEDAGDELARVGEAAPLVGVVMGSDSDLPCMSPAAALLREFGVPFELTLVSAHRTPARLCEYARRARGRGVRAIIAGAGGAAHLPGMLAAMTPLPVIGVPVPLKHLDGVDSLHSILQMPKGVPVATVAIGNSANAALLAVRILGAQMPELWDKMEAYQARMEREVLDKAARLESVGWEAYK